MTTTNHRQDRNYGGDGIEYYLLPDGWLLSHICMGGLGAGMHRHGLDPSSRDIKMSQNHEKRKIFYIP